MNGVGDLSHIEIPFAGTNSGDAHDVAAVQPEAANHRIGSSEVRG
jgi:hypothetical protein